MSEVRKMTKDELIASDESIRQAVITVIQKRDRNDVIKEEIKELKNEQVTLESECGELITGIWLAMESRGLEKMTVGCQLIEKDMGHYGTVTIREVYVAK